MGTRIRSVRRLTPTLCEAILDRPSDFSFRPGQFAAIWLPDRPRQKRLYSIASPPDAEHLRFVIEVFPDGAVSSAIASLAPGAEVGLSEAMGRFFWEEGPGSVFLAGWGSGVAPLLAIRGAARTDATLRYVALAGETCADLAVDDETRVVAGRGDAPEGLAEEAAAHDRIFLSGPHRFVRGLADDLAARGVASNRVRLEQWG